MKKLNKKNLQLIILLVLCIVFGLGCLWMSGQKEEDEEEESTQALTDLNLVSADDVIAVSYENAEAAIGFALDEAGDWYYTEDPDFSLAGEDVDTMVSYLAGLSWSRAIDLQGDVEVSDYGFDEPSYTIRITQTDQTVRTFLFGDYSNLAESYYFMEEGDDTVYLVSSVLTTYCDRALEDWEEIVDEATQTDAQDETTES